MTHLRKLQALYTAETLRMRGCGLGSYNYDYPLYDAGCYDWEVVCTPDCGYTEELDLSYLENQCKAEWDNFYDNDARQGATSNSSAGTCYDDSFYLRRGLEEIENFKNGNSPVFLSPELEEKLGLVATGISSQEITFWGLQRAAEWAPDMVALGKLASKTSAVGTILGAYLSYNDLRDGNVSPQDIGNAVGTFLGGTALILGLFSIAPIVVTSLTIGSLAISFFSYCLPDTGDENQKSSTY